MMTMGEEISALKAKVCSLTDQVTCLDLIVESLKKGNAHLKDEIASLKRALAESGTENERLRVQNLYLRNELLVRMRELASTNKAIQRANRRTDRIRLTLSLYHNWLQQMMEAQQKWTILFDGKTLIETYEHVKADMREHREIK